MSPAGSVAWTWNACSPTASDVYVLGEVQATKGPASREHLKVELRSEEVNSKVALVSTVVWSGPETIVVSGAPAGRGMISQVWVAGVGSTLPEISTART